MFERELASELKDLAKSHAPMGYLIYAGDQEQKIHSIELLNCDKDQFLLFHPRAKRALDAAQMARFL